MMSDRRIYGAGHRAGRASMRASRVALSTMRSLTCRSAAVYASASAPSTSPGFAFMNASKRSRSTADASSITGRSAILDLES